MRVLAALSMLPLASALRHMPGQYNGNGERSAGERVQDQVQKCAEEKGWEGGAWMNCENEIVCKNKKNKRQWIKHNCQWHQQEWGECWQKNHCRDLPIYIQVEECVNGDWEKWQECELKHKCRNKKYMRKALKGCDNDGSYSTGQGQCWLKDHCQWLEDEVNGGEHYHQDNYHQDNYTAQTFEDDHHHDNYSNFNNYNQGTGYDFGSADHYNSQGSFNNYHQGPEDSFHSHDNYANFASAEPYGNFGNYNTAAGTDFGSYMP